MRRRSRLRLGLSVIVCFASAAVLAQSEKVSLLSLPKPGQTVRMTMTQEMEIGITLDGAAVANPGPMKMMTTMTVTQKTGALKPDGTMEAETTYEQVKSEMSVNGQVIQTGADNPLAGKTVTVKYNRNGQMVDVMGLPETGGMNADMVKQVMISFSGNLSTDPLAVGESFSTPLDFNFPLPLPGNAPMNLSGETRTTLLSVDRDASGRSATLDDIVAGSMVADVPSPDGKSNMRMDFTLSGNGTRVMDLDRGGLRSSTSTNMVRGRMDVSGAAPAQMPSLRFEATMKVTIKSH